MVRPCSVKPFDPFATLGDVALGIIALVAVLVIIVAYLVVSAADKLQKTRWLGPIIVGTALAFAAMSFTGCTNPAQQPARDPRDPDVWRPTVPAVYPEPR